MIHSIQWRWSTGPISTNIGSRNHKGNGWTEVESLRYGPDALNALNRWQRQYPSYLWKIEKYP